jgi:hypothetical protein
VKHKTHFIEDARLHQRLIWIKSQLEPDAALDPPTSPNVIGSRLHGIVAKLKSMVSIPTGYEDETGFHFGEPPNK